MIRCTVHMHRQEERQNAPRRTDREAFHRAVLRRVIHGRGLICRRVRHLALPMLMAMMSAWLCSCDHGIDPSTLINEQPGLAGTITVHPPWPPRDSLFDFRVVLFRTYPPTGILEEFLAGRLRFSDPLPVDSTVITWQIRGDDLNGTYAYVAVAQQYGANAFVDWRVVGVYAPSGDRSKPQAVDLETGRFVRGIDIDVDFGNLPPQPF